MPIYKVTTTISAPDVPFSDTRLVEATNKSQAIQHVARETIAAEIADTKEAVRLAGLGVKIEQASNGNGAT